MKLLKELLPFELDQYNLFIPIPYEFWYDEHHKYRIRETIGLDNISEFLDLAEELTIMHLRLNERNVSRIFARNLSEWLRKIIKTAVISIKTFEMMPKEVEILKKKDSEKWI